VEVARDERQVRVEKLHPALRFVLLADLDVRLAVVVEGERDEVGAAAHRAVLGERLAARAARIREDLVLLAAERAAVGGQTLRPGSNG